MAAIDALLKLVSVQKADALIVASERVPLLKKAGVDLALSMPQVNHEMVLIFAEELVDVAQLASIKAGGTVRIDHQVDDIMFAAELRGEGRRLHLAFYRQAARKPDAGPAPARRGTGTLADRGVTGPHRVPSRSIELPGVPATMSVPNVIMPPVVAAPVLASPPPQDVAPRLTEPRSQTQPSGDPGPLLEVFMQAHREGAADVLVSAGAPVRLRVNGTLHELPVVCTSAEILGLLHRVARPTAIAELEQRGSVDVALSLSDGPETRDRRFRLHVFRQQHGLAAAVRPVRNEMPGLAQLGLPDAFRGLVQFTSGLVLLTGPTGSGKSTTLTALIEHVNLSSAKHIITLEDPVEFHHVSKRSLIHQREVGTDVASFADGLRAALREAPDIILLGEMRDPETIAAALTAAETGHLVLSTLHCANAGMAIDRILDAFPGPRQAQARLQLASVLRAVVTQALLPRQHGAGRVPAFEKMLVTPAVASQIRDGRVHQIANQIQTGRAEGMLAFDQSLAALVRSGQVALEAAMAVASDPEALRRGARGG